MKCIVPNCDSRREHRAAGISFHRFPENQSERIQWMEILGVPNFSITKYTRVCSHHFADTAFVGTNRFRRLTAGAIPIATSQKVTTNPYQRPPGDPIPIATSQKVTTKPYKRPPGVPIPIAPKPLPIEEVNIAPLCAVFVKDPFADVLLKEGNRNSVCSGSSLSEDPITYELYSPNASPSPIRSDTTEDVRLSRETPVATPTEKMSCTCAKTSTPSNTNRKSMDSTTFNPKESMEYDGVDTSEGISGQVQSTNCLTKATNTGPDLAYYNIQRLEAKITRLREMLKQKNRALHNLRQQNKRSQARLANAQEMLHEMKIENLVATVRQKQAKGSENDSLP